MERTKTTKKNLILRESFKLFLSKGYDAVSFTDIESIAKVSRGAIFHHFTNKEDLFVQVVEQFVLAFLNDVDYGEDYLLSSTPLKMFIDKCLLIIDERMTYFLQGIAKGITSAKFMSFLLYVKEHYEGWGEKIEIYENKKKQTWYSIINLAKEKNEIRSDVDTVLLAETFHNLYLGLSLKGAMIDKLSISSLRKQWYYIYEQQTIK